MKKFLTVLLSFLLFHSVNSAFAETINNNQNLFFKTNQDIKIKLLITDKDEKILQKVLELIKNDKWTDALSWAGSVKNDNLKDSLTDYILWKKYSKINSNLAELEFNNLIDFIIQHQYLPNILYLKSRAENMYLVNKIPYTFVKDYFQKIEPISTRTVIRLINDKILNNEDQNEIKSYIVKSFYNYKFDDNTLDLFLEKFGDFLTEENYNHKIEKLMFDKNFDIANRLISYTDKQHRILYYGILEINKKPKYINNILRSIPKNLRKNELLLYTRFLYEYNNKNLKNALKILLTLTDKTKKPDKWWLYQKYYIRESIREKNYKQAYFLAVNQNIPKNSPDYSEAQWIAGWIALTFLKDPKTAYYHFYNMNSAVNYPISKSRAAYWAGRAMEADNKIDEAIKWYDIGGKYSLYFYGQLSYHAKNELLNIPSLTDKSPLPESPIITKEDENNILSNTAVKMAYLMQKYNDNKEYYTELFKTTINLAKTKGERGAIFEIVKNTQNEELITKIAKYLTYKDVYFVDNLFPILNIINLENPNSHLVHSIIKQESGFHISAESKVGATGFMQLMPFTAKEVAQKMNLKYSEKSLKTNPAYNILLGSYYINSLIKQFDGSQILAIASYNAGATPVKRWINDYGDPRKMNDIKDIINWIELIGYSETRNYVQRIIEGSIVYEYILENNNKNTK